MGDKTRIFPLILEALLLIKYNYQSNKSKQNAPLVGKDNPMLISNQTNYLIGSIPTHLRNNYHPLTENDFFTRVVMAYQQQALESFICNSDGVDFIEAKTAAIGTRVRLIPIASIEKQPEIKKGDAFLVIGLKNDKPTCNPESETDFYYGITWV